MDFQKAHDIAQTIAFEMRLAKRSESEIGQTRHTNAAIAEFEKLAALLGLDVIDPENAALDAAFKAEPRTGGGMSGPLFFYAALAAIAAIAADVWGLI